MKKRLIDANALREGWLEWDPYDMIEANTVLYSIDEQPTIDAVEVVRCKDCVHRHSKLYCPMCDLLADMSEDEGFCHLGTRGDSDA